MRIAALYKKVFDNQELIILLSMFHKNGVSIAADSDKIVFRENLILDFDDCKGTAFIWVVQVLRVSLTIFL